MKFEPKTIVMKDGRECVLRPTTDEYAQEMIDYLIQTAAETPFLLRYPDEVNYTLDEERAILNRLYEDDRAVMMVGIVDGAIAGNCSISAIGDKRRIRHRCSMAIALKKEYWGQWIGTAMIEYLTELCSLIGYEQIELEVVEGNEQALRLYEGCGFIVTGRHVDAMKYDDGIYRNELIMCKKLVPAKE